MRFVARTPREGINVTDEHPLKEASVLTVGLTAALVLVTLLSYSFVDVVVFFVSPQTEARIFSGWTYGADYGDARAARLKDLTQRLVAHRPSLGYDFRVGLVDDANPNAVALPGGTILVTRGVLETVDSENELAFVLGHEFGHFDNRDHLRNLGRGFALGLLLAVMTGTDAGLLGSGVVNVATISFGRRQESRADAYALELLRTEYGHVAGSTRFLERLTESRSRFEGIADYFGTHPAPSARIERLVTTAAENGWPASGELTPLEP